MDSTLKTLVAERPLQTFLRKKNKRTEQSFQQVKKVVTDRKVSIPDEFDGRMVWEGLLTPVVNQGRCGACWSFACTSVLASRFNIQSMGLMHVWLSPTKPILCDWQGKELLNTYEVMKSYYNSLATENSACFGNTLFDTWRYLYVMGTPSNECVPYNEKLGTHVTFQKLASFSGSADSLPLCSNVTGPEGDMCANFYIDSMTGEEGGDPERFYRAYHFYSLAGVESDGGSEKDIRQEIFVWGPVSTAMRVYANFYTFNPKTQIYDWDGKGKQIAGHAIFDRDWETKIS